MLPYDYYVLWTTPLNRAPFFDAQETNLKILHASPPLIGRILNLVIATGILGFIVKLYKPSEANMLFDGASLILYMCGVIVYLANIVKGLRTASAGAYGATRDPVKSDEMLGMGGDEELLSREDSLRVMAASNTILALVLVGVLVLQAGQWYAQKKEETELAEMRKKRLEDKATGGKGAAAKKKN
jgi:ER membrane protein SH3